jgi:hypothetical protein
MSQSNLSRFYQKRQKKNNALLSGIISGRSKYAKTKKNPSEAGAATPSATAAASQRMETIEEFSNFEENSRSAPEFEIIERRAGSPRIVIETRAESPAATTQRFEIIESAATSPVTAAAATAETTTSRPASKRRRTEEGSVGQHSDGNIRKNVK